MLITNSCRIILGVMLFTGKSAPGSEAPNNQKTPSEKAGAIPWDQIGAKAGEDYHGDGLSVTATDAGARLRCVFQRLEGEVTGHGLWLTSTVTNQPGERFQVVATAVGTQGLVGSGTVSVAGAVVRFTRPKLIEEYSVSLDGVRQDFLVSENSGRAGELRVLLAVEGARVRRIPGGAELILDKSGRRLVYSRLRATDADGKELPAYIEAEENSENLLTVMVNDAGADYPVRIDPTFSDANWVGMGGVNGTDGYVYATVANGSGNLYIGGEFAIAGNVAANNVAEWDGSAWSALGSGMNRTVYALTFTGGTLYAGGAFTNAGGTAANYIAQWKGTNWSALGSGMNSNVYALAVSGTTLYAGGRFTNSGGAAAHAIAQWNGTNWSPLGSGMAGGGVNGPNVRALAVSGGTLYAGGFFTFAGGTPANAIAGWNGSSWSALGTGVSGASSAVFALAVTGGTLYAGGSFTTAGFTLANHVAQWNGTSWSALGTGVGGGDFAGPEVLALAVAGGTLYAGGDFTTAGGSPARYIARWNGSSWAALGTGFNGYIYGLALSGSTLYAGGFFTTAGGTNASNAAQWNGSSWSALGGNMNGDVNALAVSANTLYAGGSFTLAGGTNANYVAQWDGHGWSALGSGMNGPVSALAVSANTLYAGGNFTNAGGTAANYIAQWDGSSWSALGSGMNAQVAALTVSGGALYTGGFFTIAGGANANYVARWDGNSWSALGSAMNNGVAALAVSGGTLYAGGYFTTAGGAAATNIAQWNGTSWSALGSGMGGGDGYGPYVLALGVSGGTLYAGGDFTNAGGAAANYIAQWNGTSWSALGSGMGTNFPIVKALTVSGDILYAGGGFTKAGTSAANFIARWNGTNWSALGSGMGSAANSHVNALAIWGSTLYAGGNFWTAGGKASAYAAEAYLVTPPGGVVDSIAVPISGTADVNCHGNPGQQFGVQRTAILSPSNWSTVNSGPLIPAADGSFIFIDTNAASSAAFYRAFQY